LPMMMMAWSNPGSEYSFEKMLGDKQLANERSFRALSAFFESEIQRGNLAPVSSTVLTRMFVGTLRDFCMSELLANTEEHMPPQELAESVVDLILRAARPSPDLAETKPAPVPAPSRARVRTRTGR
ncbi:MAG: hypothetical protein ABIP89_12145, partial [Polyangiaceae bacterium]